MNSQRNNLITRLAVPLAGLLITAHLMIPEERTEANAAKNRTVEQLRLGPEDGVEIVQENVYDKGSLFDHRFFEERFGNRQVWACFQMLKTRGHTVCLYFVDFRNQEDADWAMQRLMEEQNHFVTRKCRTFGTVVVYVQAPPDAPISVMDEVLQSVHAQVD